MHFFVDLASFDDHATRPSQAISCEPLALISHWTHRVDQSARISPSHMNPSWGPCGLDPVGDPVASKPFRVIIEIPEHLRKCQETEPRAEEEWKKSQRTMHGKEILNVGYTPSPRFGREGIVMKMHTFSSQKSPVQGLRVKTRASFPGQRELSTFRSPSVLRAERKESSITSPETT